jgi:hypothetical protein
MRRWLLPIAAPTFHCARRTQPGGAKLVSVPLPLVVSDGVPASAAPLETLQVAMMLAY